MKRWDKRIAKINQLEIEMKSRFFGLLIMAAALVLATANQASAAFYEFSGSGTWQSSALNTAYSAPNQSYTFSFDLPNPTSGNPDTEAFNFQYTLNGIAVSATLLSVEFFSDAVGGGFNLNLGSGGPLQFFNVLGGSTPDFTSGITAGSFLTNIVIADNTNGDSVGSASVVITAVPEPSTWAMMLLGFFGVGFVAYRRRTSAAVRLA
jgi:hypothetical protein